MKKNGKKSVDLSADVRRHETGLSSACQCKINQNLKCPDGQEERRGWGVHVQRDLMPAFRS